MQLEFTDLVSDLDEITSEDTDAVVIITHSEATIGLRMFGDRAKCRAAIEEVLARWDAQ